MASLKTYEQLLELRRKLSEVAKGLTPLGYIIPYHVIDTAFLVGDQDIGNYHTELYHLRDNPAYTIYYLFKRECLVKMLDESFNDVQLESMPAGEITPNLEGRLCLLFGFSSPSEEIDPKTALAQYTHRVSNKPFQQLYTALNDIRTEIESFISPEAKTILDKMTELYSNCFLMLALISYNTKNNPQALSNVFMCLDDAIQAYIAEDFRANFPEHEFSNQHFPYSLDKKDYPANSPEILDGVVSRKLRETVMYLDDLVKTVERLGEGLETRSELLELIDRVKTELMGEPREKPPTGMKKYPDTDNSLLAHLERYTELVRPKTTAKA